MGKLGKVIGYTFVGLVGLSVLTNMIPQEDQKPASKEVTKHVANENKAEPKKVTEDNFNKVVQGDMMGEGGQPIDQVYALLGKPDSVTKSNTGNMQMEVAAWSSWKDGLSITITFTNGKVSSKTLTKL